jgi:hypothetical protein
MVNRRVVRETDSHRQDGGKGNGRREEGKKGRREEGKKGRIEGSLRRERKSKRELLYKQRLSSLAEWGYYPCHSLT